MKKAKKAIIIILVILFVLAVALFAAYEIGLKFAADKAVNTIITNEINEMLDSGEISLDEVIEIAGDDSATVNEPADENPEQQAQEVKPETKKTVTAVEKKEAVKKAAEKVNEDIAARDKREVMDLIRSNLTNEDMKFLLSALKGGVTKAEIKEAAKIAYSRFDSEEIVRVKEFWHKYKNTIKRAKE